MICVGNLNNIKTWKNHIRVRRLCKNFVLSNTKLRQFMNRMSYCINQGLGKNTHSEATVKCWQTYAQDMPTGKEEGQFLALDLGGSNFRILKLELGKNKYFKMDQNVFACSKELMTGTGLELFDYIANCLHQFVTTNEIKSQHALPLGFTFSFPMSQLSIDSGKLVRWTKGFTCDGVVGQDIVELLNKSINNIPGLNIKTCAILNDTVGTLMSCAWKNPKTRVGLIIGTGCNVCYIEKVCLIINAIPILILFINTLPTTSIEYIFRQKISSCTVVMMGKKKWLLI